MQDFAEDSIKTFYYFKTKFIEKYPQFSSGTFENQNGH